ncbi:MAG: hypothetical protein KDI83_05650 [Gammaproteobacteria bacterium]|nr:hypothetical protein [Gammaproteobacteria bacterium]
MRLQEDFQRMILRIGSTVTVPAVQEVLLPVQRAGVAKRDEFGFLVLADGSVGPFYTRLDDSFCNYSDDWLCGADPLALALQLGDEQLQTSALALGALNAISQWMMRSAGFDPTASPAPDPMQQADRIGMVGYFAPLVERLRAQGHSITLIEKDPARVPPELGIAVSSEPAALMCCDYIICTASTLINNTLQQVLDAASTGCTVNLLGPSASCLPDPLFAAGVHLAGGVLIDDLAALRSALQCGDSWGSCGRKYSLSAAGYPGLEQLLARIGQR